MSWTLFLTLSLGVVIGSKVDFSVVRAKLIEVIRSLVDVFNRFIDLNIECNVKWGEVGTFLSYLSKEFSEGSKWAFREEKLENDFRRRRNYAQATLERYGAGKIDVDDFNDYVSSMIHKEGKMYLSDDVAGDLRYFALNFDIYNTELAYDKQALRNHSLVIMQALCIKYYDCEFTINNNEEYISKYIRK